MPIPSKSLTLKKIKEEAKKYKTRNEFRLGSSSYYYKAKKSNWLNRVCSHMQVFSKPIGYWTFDNLKKEALKYDSKQDFMKNSSGAYNKAFKTGVIEKICSHMVEIRKPVNYWVFDRIKKVAKKCKTKTEFFKKYGGAYMAARENGWLDETCSHMFEIKKPYSYWTFDKCEEKAKIYKSRVEFAKKSNYAYNIARENGWLDKVCSHMISTIKPKGYWHNKENCKLESLKYKKRTEFEYFSSGAYNISLKNKWLDEFFHKIKK